MPEVKTSETGARIGDVELIWARNSKEFLFSNSILVHGDEPIIVDPSANFSYISQLAESHIVKTVLNTHYHGDHRSLNHLFKDVVFSSHEDDAKAISNFDHYAKIAVSDEKAFYLEWIKKVFIKHKIVDCPVSLRFKDGDEISAGTETIQIISIPGHTPGHIALYFKEADLLYTSDIDLTPFGPWYANEVSAIEPFKESVAKIRGFKAQYYVPSHGERIYDREQFLEKLDRFNACFNKREQRILDLLKEGPMSLAELSSHGIIYKKSSLIDPLKCYFQFHMVKKHVDLFVKQGVVVEQGDILSLSNHCKSAP